LGAALVIGGQAAVVAAEEAAVLVDHKAFTVAFQILLPLLSRPVPLDLWPLGVLEDL
jgi:hypothetical protein